MSLPSDSPVDQNDTGKTAGGRRQDIDWGRFGLSEKSTYEPRRTTEFLYTTEKKEKVRELFEDEGQGENQEPWWKSSFFITRTLLFGTWDGVFTSCVVNIVGVVIFLRTGWMVGYAGIGLSLLVVIISFLVAVGTVMSACGVCDRCDVKGGGVYFIVSHVLGGKIGGTVGLVYCLGHATATALYCTGFAESLSNVIGWHNDWAIRTIALITLLIILVIAICGVKWVIRFQLLLIVILAVAVLDFVIGTLVHTRPDKGVTGFSGMNFKANTDPLFTSKISFFTVLGVFFPAACGVMAGVNMSGDLKDPAKNIPVGSLAALAVTGGTYILFIFLLGATCTRHALRSNYMIMQEVSVVGALFLLGLYVSSLSSVLGGLVGPPRVLQRISEENILPVLQPFAKTRGINNEPQNATFVIAFITILFILIGQLNTLATIVTMPFLMTYTAINYSYFALAMSYEIKQQKKLDELNKPSVNGTSYLLNGTKRKKTNGAVRDNEKLPLVDDTAYYGTNGETDSSDMKQKETRLEESLIETRLDKDEQTAEELSEGISKDQPTSSSKSEEATSVEEGVSASQSVEAEAAGEHPDNEVRLEFVKEKEPSAIYAKFCNRWVSLFVTFFCFIMMFCISWTYALANLSITLLMYIFIGQSSPGLSLGVSSDFSFSKWVTSAWRKDEKGNSEKRIIVQKSFVPYGISMYQITEDNLDYAGRDRKHHSSVLTNPAPYD